MKSGIRKIKDECKLKMVDGKEVEFKGGEQITANAVCGVRGFFEVSLSDGDVIGVARAKQIKGKSVRV